MKHLIKLPNIIEQRKWFVHLLIVGGLTYFTYHFFQGERGLISLWNLQQQVDRDQKKLDQHLAIKNTLEQQVSLMRPDRLDLDMLEERARIFLHLAAPDEIVVKIPPSNHLHVDQHR